MGKMTLEELALEYKRKDALREEVAFLEYYRLDINEVERLEVVLSNRTNGLHSLSTLQPDNSYEVLEDAE